MTCSLIPPRTNNGICSDDWKMYGKEEEERAPDGEFEMDEEEPIHDGGGAGLADLDAAEIEQVPYTLARAYHVLLVRSRRAHALAPFIASCLVVRVPSPLALSVYRLSLSFLRTQAAREEEVEVVRDTIPRSGVKQTGSVPNPTKMETRATTRLDLGTGRKGTGRRREKKGKGEGGDLKPAPKLPRAHVHMPRLTRGESVTSG